MYSCFWHSRYNVSMDSKSKCLHCLGKNSFFFCSYNIITLFHHSAYHSLFYWSISCTEPDQSVSPCIKRELFFILDQPHWPPPNHFSMYHIPLEVKAPEQVAVFRILVLLNDTVMASPLFSTFPLAAGILFGFLAVLTFSAWWAKHKDSRICVFRGDGWFRVREDVFSTCIILGVQTQHHWVSCTALAHRIVPSFFRAFKFRYKNTAW